MDVWNCQEKYLNDLENLKCLEVEVSAGFLLYIPPYWFYSIKYSKSENGLTQIFEWTYNSIMNVASNLPDWTKFYLQQWNTEKKILKKLKIHEEEPAEEEPIKDEI